MNSDESFSTSSYLDQTHLEELELASLIGAVTELFGREQARLSATDWLDECELMDSPPRSTSRNWRAVSGAASARLPSRVIAARDHRIPTAPTYTKLTPMTPGGDASGGIPYVDGAAHPCHR